MMYINVLIKAHAYAEERLLDKCFDEPPHYGIVGPEVMAPLARFRNKSFNIAYEEGTTVSQFRESVDTRIWGFPSTHLLFQPQFTFEYKDERFEVENHAAIFSLLLSKYLDPEHTGIITVCYLVCHDAGRVGPDEGKLRYYVHSREAGKHHEPHIHVKDVEERYEASVRISDGKVIAGNLPNRYQRIAEKEILNNQDYYFNCWNTLSDGLKADINHHFGLIQY